MKKLLNITILFIAVAVFAGCANNPSEKPEYGNRKTFTAYSVPATRTSLGSNCEILWSQSDSINVFTSEGRTYVFRDVTVSQDGKTATFTGEIPVSDSYLAQYPANSDAYCEAGYIFATLPSFQTATASGFDPKANIAVSQTTSEELYFKNIGALIGFRINNDNIVSITLNATEASGRQMTGQCGIEMKEGIPTAYSLGGEEYVTLTGDFQEGETYYACVLPGTYSSLVITFEDNTGRIATFNNSNTLTLTRNQIIDICNITVDESDWKEAQGTDWTIVTSTSGLIPGNDFILACNDIGDSGHNCVIASELKSDVLQQSTATSWLSTDKQKFTSTPDNALLLTLGGTSGNWVFTNSIGDTLGATAVKKLAWNAGTRTWNISFSGSNATITNSTSSYGTFKYNNTSPRFTTYGSSYSGKPVQLYSRMKASSVTTVASASDITKEGATVQGSYICIKSLPSEAGFMYGLSESSMTATVYATEPTAMSDTFEATLAGLSSSTTYYYKAFVKEGNTFIYGKASSFTTLAGGGGGSTGLADYCWPELPGQKDADRNGIDDDNPDYYYSHTMRADASTIRNFSSCYSKSMIHPVWVAAPMHSSYLGKSGRNDSYKNDPNIKCTQSAKFDGYTRGHMVGSSDRTISVATNRQAFYYSNIGAQLGQPGFNTGGGCWNILEDKVDTYVCSDTLYQVIGCIFETFTDKYGTTVTKKTGSGSAGTFQVPTAWYKVLLRTKQGNSGKNVSNCTSGELQCVAFILGHYHNKSHQPNANDMYTVSELETLTGLTFFVNVPNAPKTSFSASDWGL